MKVHGEGLVDGLKLTLSDEEECESSDENEEDENELELDESEANGESRNCNNRTKHRKGRKRMSLNSNGDRCDEDENVDEEEEEEEEEDGDDDEEVADYLAESGKRHEEIKREFSPEQSGDGKRPYRQRCDDSKVVRSLTPLRKSKRRLSASVAQGCDSEADATTLAATKRVRKARQQLLDEVAPTTNGCLLDANTTPDTPTNSYYPLAGYARHYAAASGQAANAQAYGNQCGGQSAANNEQYNQRQQHHHYASQIQSNSQESNSSSSALGGDLPSLSSASAAALNGQQQRNAHSLASPTSAHTTTNANSPPHATLSEW